MESSNKKKILVVAESINVEDSSGSKANVAFILNLKEAGYKVLVYHYTRKEIQLPGIKCIAIKEKKCTLNFLLSRIQRKIQHGFQVNLAKYLEPVFGFSFTFFNDTNSIARAVGAEKDFKPDLIMTLSKGASFRPHYALLKLPELQQKWLAYIHDPFPFYFYPEPYNWKEPGYKQHIAFFENVSKKCRWAGFPSLLLKEWMEKFFPAFEAKSVILPHQLNEIEIENVALPEYFQLEKFNLLHSGHLMKQRPPFYLITAFEKFLDKNPEAKRCSRLLLIGSASYHKNRLEKRNLSGEIFISYGNVEYKQVLAMQKKAAVNIILESKAVLSPFLPGKFPHCIAADKPMLILGPAKSEVRRLLGEEYPFWSEIDDVEKITVLIGGLFQKWRNNQEQKLNRQDVKEYLSHRKLKIEIDKILE